MVDHAFDGGAFDGGAFDVRIPDVGSSGSNRLDDEQEPRLPKNYRTGLEPIAKVFKAPVNIPVDDPIPPAWAVRTAPRLLKPKSARPPLVRAPALPDDIGAQIMEAQDMTDIADIEAFLDLMDSR